MKGIRNKILLGFSLLAGLLLLTGIITYVEFSGKSHVMQLTADKGMRAVQISNAMLEEAEKTNDAVLSLAFQTEKTTGATPIVPDTALFGKLYTELRILFPGNKELDTLLFRKTVYDAAFATLHDSSETDIKKWYSDVYKKARYLYATSVIRFMNASQASVRKEVENHEDQTYRAIMPETISLIVAVVIIIMFFFLIDTYYIRPVEDITRALKNHLSMRTPFKVTVEGKEEVRDLKEYIEQLINLSHIKKKE